MNAATFARNSLHAGRVLGALAVLVLLLAFAGVVRKAVQQAEASRRAGALLAEAHWRCQALKGPAQRTECLRRFHDERPDDSAALQQLVRSATLAPLAALTPPR